MAVVGSDRRRSVARDRTDPSDDIVRVYTSSSALTGKVVSGKRLWRRLKN